MVKQIFEYGPLFAWAAMLVTAVRPLRLRVCHAAAVSLALLAATVQFLVYRHFGGDSFLPDLPQSYITVSGWIFWSAMVFFGLSCLRLAAALAFRRLRGKRPARIALASLAAVSAAAAGMGVWEGVKTPEVNRVEISFPNLPEALDGFRIVHLTDIHCSPASRKDRMQALADKVNSLSPDLVCITGDTVDGHPEDREEDLRPLASIKAKHGVWACTGNHEYYHDYKVWRDVYPKLGIKMLDNAHATISANGAEFALGGVTDATAADNWVRRMEPGDAAKAFAGVKPSTFRILMQHRPATRGKDDPRVDLQLSGHTHGGAVLGLDFLVAHMGNKGYVRGLYRRDGRTVYVSSGTGQWAGFPLRIGVPSEIAEIVLRAER